MKAAVLETPGAENLKIKEVLDPRPGRGEVLVRLHASSLNYRDYVVVQGGYGSQQKRHDLIPLSDGAGVVAEVGPGVVGLKGGDRVVGCFFPEWTSGEPSAENLAVSLGGTVDGVASEYRVFPEHGLVPSPDYLTDGEAATLPCAALTAWNALVVLGGIAPGDVVLTQGTGGVAVFALQFARMAGAEVIATSSTEEKLARLRALSARHAINYAADREWGATARTLTGGRGVDHVVEVGGADTLKQSLRAVRIGGVISVIGVLSGGTADVNLASILMHNVRVQGIRVGSREHFLSMLRAMALHGLRPVIDRTFPLADLPAALEYLKAGRHVGKVVIEI
jgi:NADPH:quinone reductase-like Zn-dependent oxidoreductase